MCVFFFFKQKTAYEMRISDWSSDVCSSDLRRADAIWRDPQRETIKGAVWLANMGYGRLSEAEETAFKEELQRRAGSLDRPIVVFCEPDCWMSWNAAKRALSYGFRNIIWFPDRSEEHTSELQSLMRNSYAVLCLKK